MNKKEILERLEKGLISVDEAMKLMEEIAVEEDKKQELEVVEPVVFEKKERKKYKYLIIKVNGEDGEKVNVTLPVGLLKYAKNISGAFVKDKAGQEVLSNINIDEILEMMEHGQEGRKIIDIKSDGESVEIYFE